MDDIWISYKPLIKRLYQDERKSLKDVKHTLETEHGFPEQSLSVYETTLRDVLKLRKKLKKGDWEHIYRYAQSRGYSQYEVQLNGTSIPWVKAWKEIRRSGATRAILASNLREPRLPAGVTIVPRSEPLSIAIRSPPTPSHNELPRRSSGPVIPYNTEAAQRSSTQIELPLAIKEFRPTSGHWDGDERTSVAQYHSTFVKLVLETLPWHELRRIVLASLSAGQMITKCEVVNGIAFALMANDGFFETDLAFLRISDSLYPTFWTILEPYISIRALSSTTNCASYKVTALVYVLSNGLYWEGWHGFLMSCLGEELQRLPQGVVARLFRSHSLSFRALWDRFIRDSSTSNGSEGATFVVTMLLDIYPEWTLGKRNGLIIHAIITGQLTLVNKLLARGARPVYSQRWGETAISKPSPVGPRSGVKALTESHNVKAFDVDGYTITQMPMGQFINVCESKTVDATTFSLFLSYMFKNLDLSKRSLLRSDGLEVINSKEERLLHTLEMFLDAGADVDWSFPFAFCGLYHFRELFDEGCKWLPSCLDAAFYLCNPIFQRIRSRSKKDHDAVLTRSGTSNAAAKGAIALEAYLRPRIEPLEQKQYLELALLEQFFLQPSDGIILPFRSTSQARVSRTLIELGATINSKHVDKYANSLHWRVCILSARKFGLNEDLVYLIDHFLQELSLSSSDLADCVEQEGTEILEAIARADKESCIDFGAVGGSALLKAARFENYEAVAWLLQMGADINSEVDEGSKCATIIGHLLRGTPDITMFQHLINQGVKLRYRILDETCYPLFEVTILRFKDDEFLSNFPQEEMKNITVAQWNILLRKLAALPLTKIPEALELFRKLLRQFYVASAGPILATIISAGATRELIQELLDWGVDVNEYSYPFSPLQRAIMSRRFDLAYWLIELGADVNNAQSVERPMRSTLHTACTLNVNSNKYQREKKKFILFLISQGADVDGNTDGEEIRSYRPLCACAFAGDIDIATLLLQHRAYPNSISAEFRPETALDVAASSGKLDMVQLLLKVGGLSVEPGSSGYEGAIKKASRYGYGAVAELIKRHISHNEQQFELCAELRRKHQILIGRLEEAVRRMRAQGEDSVDEDY